MILNKNSVSARLYRWFYNKIEEEMPTNLCPYFWKLLLMWLLFIPVFIITLPGEIFFWVTDDYDSGFGPKLGFTIVLYVALYALTCMGLAVSLFFVTYVKGSFLAISSQGGLTLWSAGIIITIYCLINKAISRIKRISKEPKLNNKTIVSEFIKAQLGKYCPKIDWE